MRVPAPAGDALSLAYKPHSWTVRERVKGQSSGKATSGTYGSTTTIRGQITPISQEAAYAQFGIDAKDTFMALVDVADAASHPIEAEVEWNGYTLVVRAHDAVYTLIGPADHSAILLERQR